MCQFAKDLDIQKIQLKFFPESFKCFEYPANFIIFAKDSDIRKIQLWWIFEIIFTFAKDSDIRKIRIGESFEYLSHLQKILIFKRFNSNFFPNRSNVLNILLTSLFFANLSNVLNILLTSLASSIFILDSCRSCVLPNLLVALSRYKLALSILRDSCVCTYFLPLYWLMVFIHETHIFHDGVYWRKHMWGQLVAI